MSTTAPARGVRGLSPATILARDVLVGDRISRKARVHRVLVNEVAGSVKVAYKVQGTKSGGVHAYSINQPIVVWRKEQG